MTNKIRVFTWDEWRKYQASKPPRKAIIKMNKITN